eukprot:gene9705-3360_t
MSAEQWAHCVRDAARRRQWAAAQARRAVTGSDDLQGIEEAGVDRRATMALHDHRRTTPLHQGFLRAIITGGVLSGKRLGEMFPKLYPNGHCLFCSTAAEPVVETMPHIWWASDPDWDGADPSDAEAEAAADAADAAEAALAGNQLPSRLGPPTPATDACRDARGEARANHRVIVFTDGAATNNQDARFRRAGSGAYWGPRHPLNSGKPLAGPDQGDNAAELQAVIDALEADPRPLQIRSDSAHVRDGWKQYRHRWRATGWRPRVLSTAEIRNAERWQRLDQLLRSRGEGHDEVTWVKGHTTPAQVAAGEVTPFNKAGNDAADDLATTGAACHAVPAAEVQAAAARTQLALSLHRLMLDISERRAAALAARGLPSEISLGIKDGRKGRHSDRDAARLAEQQAAAAVAPAADALRTVDNRLELYPWGWAPPPPHATGELHLKPPFRDRKVTRVAAIYTALKPGGFHFAPGATILRWPAPTNQHAATGVTWAELVVDFEAFTGVDVPPPQRVLVQHGDVWDGNKIVDKNIKGQRARRIIRNAADAYVRAGVTQPGSRPHIRRTLHERAERLSEVWCSVMEMAQCPFAPGHAISTHSPGSSALGIIMRDLGARPDARRAPQRFAGWSRKPLFAAGERTESVLRDLATRPQDWDRMNAAGEPDYSPLAAERRAAAARFRDLSELTDDPDLQPPAVAVPHPPRESDTQLLARIVRERGAEDAPRAAGAAPPPVRAAAAAPPPGRPQPAAAAAGGPAPPPPPHPKQRRRRRSPTPAAAAGAAGAAAGSDPPAAPAAAPAERSAPVQPHKPAAQAPDTAQPQPGQPGPAADEAEPPRRPRTEEAETGAS